ncbi:MAG TPA: hypothetical protein VE570_09250 [Thermoleophilaceae bacterium]|jgi:hypothetical protein|nr:hypothetical protein [Thermoleophilaceae bacterium]
MSDTALALTYVDPGRGLYATARSDFALLFEDGKASSFDDESSFSATADGWQARLPGGIDLALRRIGEAVELGGMRASLCSAATGLGVVAEIHDPPRWQELDATRYVCALFDPQNAVIAFARRPTGARGHGHETIVAHLWTDGELKSVEEARLSTIYDGDGRPRQASMELWLPGEDFPRRAFGAVTAGASLALEGLDVHAAAMDWRMDTHRGAGVYELTVREPAPAAA